MSQRAIGICRAALAGAVFGSAIGAVAVPRDRKVLKRRAKFAGNAMRVAGTAMWDIAELMKRL